MLLIKLSFFVAFTSASPETDQFWCCDIKTSVVAKFGKSALSSQESEASFKLNKGIVHKVLLDRIQEITGMTLFVLLLLL